VKEKTELEGMTTRFYENLYTSEGTHNMEDVLNSIPSKLNVAMREMLTAPYSKDEVKTALFQMFTIKSPGPDGFPAHFF